jgi:hypothetical protein
MKKILIILFILIIKNIAFTQSINWTHIYHDGAGKPLYTGGFTISSPTFADIDDDGDYDCFIGSSRDNNDNGGKIHYFENIGTQENCIWHFVTDTYNDINFYYFDLINVTFADIDNDDDLDMFVGGYSFDPTVGIHFYRNIGNAQNPIWEFVSDKFQDIETLSGLIRNFCKTTFADIDNDDDLDLLFGNYFREVYYENIGDAANPIFVLVSSNYFDDGGGWNNHRPIFVDINDDGDYDCFIGIPYHLLYYENIGIPESPEWNLVTDDYNETSGMVKSPEFCDIDNDGDYDMFVGVLKGKILFYENIGSSNEPIWDFIGDNPITLDAGFYSSPAFCDIDGDNKAEMFVIGSSEVYEYYSCPINIYYYNNINTPEQPAWELQSSSFPYINYNNDGVNSIDFADIDSDGDYDLFVGLINNSLIMFHENTGDIYIPQFDSIGTMVINFSDDGDIKFTPSLVDIDADGDLDMFISSQNGIVGSTPGIHFYRNEGDQFSPDWQFDSIINSLFGKVDFMDEDNDGDYDLFLSESFFNNNIIFYRNTGDIYNFCFEFDCINYGDIYVGRFPTICFFDIDNDNDKDMILGEYDGGINLFRNDGFVSIDNNHLDFGKTLLLNNYPNPFNPSTTIQFSNEQNQPQLYNGAGKYEQIKIEIYNIKGQKVKEFLIVSPSPGHTLSVTWDGTDENNQPVSSGIYFYKLKINNTTKAVRKMLLIK